MTGRVRSVIFVVAILGCGQSSPGQPDGSLPPDGPQPPSDSRDAASVRYLCKQEPPIGAPQPVPPPPYAGTCPTLAPGLNAITSSGDAREFLLVVPESPMPSEQLPVLFMWHWLGGSANSFLERGDVQNAANQQRFIAVLPVSIGASVLGTSFDTRWPFDITQTQARMDREFRFFDDMLSCVGQQLSIDRSCVSSIGVSAGALFTAQLAQARSQQLASFVSLSGGVGATLIKPWNGAARKLPGVVLWGGDGPPTMDGSRDLLGCAGIGMDFSVASNQLESGLTAGGHFFVECKHNCGHVEPPLVPPEGESKYAGMWEFVLDHPYWLPAGQSPYLTDGLPPTLPSWCGIGASSAMPRSGGGCPPGENPCTN
jgi:predicted esterase